MSQKTHRCPQGHSLCKVRLVLQERKYFSLTRHSKFHLFNDFFEIHHLLQPLHDLTIELPSPATTGVAFNGYLSLFLGLPQPNSSLEICPKVKHALSSINHQRKVLIIFLGSIKLDKKKKTFGAIYVV